MHNKLSLSKHPYNTQQHRSRHRILPASEEPREEFRKVPTLYYKPRDNNFKEGNVPCWWEHGGKKLTKVAYARE